MLRTELRALQTASSEDDVVVVAFSGHGSNTHELIPYDADLYDLPGTTLPLDELIELISGIPAKHLLVVLDCCFSGGAGSKVLRAPAVPRGGPGACASTPFLIPSWIAGPNTCRASTNSSRMP
jgi:helicase